MPIKVKVIHAQDFVRANAEGVLDMQECERLLAAIAAASAQLDEFEVILDTRKAQAAMEVGALWHLAAKFAEHPGIFGRRTAVLCPPARFDHATFFALCAKNRGLNVHAFESFEDAIEWLYSPRATES
jgi:hypothetical protein